MHLITPFFILAASTTVLSRTLPEIPDTFLEYIYFTDKNSDTPMSQRVKTCQGFVKDAKVKDYNKCIRGTQSPDWYITYNVDSQKVLCDRTCEVYYNDVAYQMVEAAKGKSLHPETVTGSMPVNGENHMGIYSKDWSYEETRHSKKSKNPEASAQALIVSYKWDTKEKVSSNLSAAQAKCVDGFHAAGANPAQCASSSTMRTTCNTARGECNCYRYGCLPNSALRVFQWKGGKSFTDMDTIEYGQIDTLIGIQRNF